MQNHLLFNRREFFDSLGKSAASVAWFASLSQGRAKFPAEFAVRNYKIRSAAFAISLSQRSLTHSITSGRLEHLEFAKFARQEFQIKAVDYVSSFFRDQVTDKDFLTEMNKRAAAEEVRHILLKIDDEGDLMTTDDAQRQQAVERHRLWIDAAATLGCRGVRIHLNQNATTPEDFERAVLSIKGLDSYASERKIQVLIGNQIGAPQDSSWLVKLVKQVDSKGLGTFPYFLPDPAEQQPIDLYKNLSALMPFAKGVCASSREFDEQGREKNIDFYRMLKIVTDSGYAGYICLEFQKPTDSETESDEPDQESKVSKIVTNLSTDHDKNRKGDREGDQKKTEDRDGSKFDENEVDNRLQAGSLDDPQKLTTKQCERELAGIKATLKLLTGFKSALSDPPLD